MRKYEKYDRMYTGVLSGILLPLVTGLLIYIFTADGKSIAEYLARIEDANIITHAVTLCVFPNIAAFILFNRLDMLRAMRGVLASTIFWAITVFVIKFI
jgi:hypothetical protein